MKRIWLWGAVLGASALLNGCTSDTDNDGGTPPPAHQEGYADPDGVILLNQGARMSENGSISYLAPDGTIERMSTGRSTVRPSATRPWTSTCATGKSTS